MKMPFWLSALSLLVEVVKLILANSNGSKKVASAKVVELRKAIKSAKANGDTHAIEEVIRSIGVSGPKPK